jgi:hypothetical protein
MIVSVGHILDAGYSVEFNTNTKMCYLWKADSTVIGNIPKGINGLFKLDHAMAANRDPVPASQTGSRIIRCYPHAFPR